MEAASICFHGSARPPLHRLAALRREGFGSRIPFEMIHSLLLGAGLDADGRGEIQLSSRPSNARCNCRDARSRSGAP